MQAKALLQYPQRNQRKEAMQTLTLIQPDDWHCHLRDGTALHRTVQDTEKRFARAIIMPNLTPPVTRIAQAKAYRQRILAASNTNFSPLMTLFLNAEVSPEELGLFSSTDGMTACKYYPAGATTNSDSGSKGIQTLTKQLEAMQRLNIPLLVHGESIKPGVDIFDREKQFIDEELTWAHKQFPELRIVFEHASSADAVNFVINAGDTVAATVTPQHLLLNRNDLLAGGLKPDYYCLPILKTKNDQDALTKAVLSGHPRFFLGTDSAPHARNKKYNCCGCAGCYTACSAIELYANFFDQHGALDKFESFASRNGPKFYQLPANTSTITLIKQPWQIPSELPFNEDDVVIPLFAGLTLPWQLQYD